MSNGKQTALDQIRSFIEEFHPADTLPTWFYRDHAAFGEVNGANGRRQILPPKEAWRVRINQRRYRQPKPPRIQVLLKQAYELKERLERHPGISRKTLARKMGISPTRLTMILNLLNLAPSIQKHILSLPSSTRMGPITERRLRHLARSRDWDFQKREFEQLLSNTHKNLRQSGPNKVKLTVGKILVCHSFNPPSDRLRS